MATVPRLEGPSVSLQGVPNVRQSNPVSADLLGVGARQQQQAGAALGGLGEELMAREKRAVDQANALRVEDVYAKATEAAMRLQSDQTDGYAVVKGDAALNRQSGMSLADEYTGKLDTTLGTLASGLANDDQRRLFAMRASGLRSTFYGQVLAYQRGQFQDYSFSKLEAIVPNATNALVLNPSDPTNVQTQVTRLRAAYEGGIDENGTFVPGMAQMQGKSATWAKEEADKAVSAAHLGAIQAAMEAGNLNGAAAYRQKYADQITAGDMLKIDGTLKQSHDTALGAAAADAAFRAAQPALAPTDIDRVVAITRSMESGGQRFGKDGKLLQGPVTRSGERAMGEMQVMPSTARNPGYGIKPADPNDPDDVARVGVQKMQALIKMFNGDLGKAWGAYNWGEGNVQAAERSAKDNPGKTWLDFAPAETQAYVRNGLSQWNRGSNPQPRPTREDVIGAAERQLGPNASPGAIQAARTRAVQRFEDLEKAEKQRADDVVLQAQQQLIQNPDYTQLPASTRDALAQYAPGKVEELMTFAGKLRAGQPIETDWNVYGSLRDQATRDPQGFAARDLRTDFMKLAPAQREQLLDLQTKLRDPKNAPAVASLDAQLDTAHNLLKFKSSDHDKKGLFDNAVMQEIAAEQARKGAVLTYDERQKVIDRQMTTGEVPGMVWNSSKRYYEVAGTEGANTFSPKPSSDEKEKIVAALKRAGRPVTDAEVNRLYRMKAGL